MRTEMDENAGKYSRVCSRTVSFVFEQSGSPFPERGLIVLVTRRPELSAILNCATFDHDGYDASVDSWFREIHVPRAWRVYLATGFDFREKNVFFLGRSEAEYAVSLLPCHFTMKER